MISLMFFVEVSYRPLSSQTSSFTIKFLLHVTITPAAWCRITIFLGLIMKIHTSIRMDRTAGGY